MPLSFISSPISLNTTAMLKAIDFQSAPAMTDDFYLPFAISFPGFVFKLNFRTCFPKTDILILILAYCCNNFQETEGQERGKGALLRIGSVEPKWNIFLFPFLPSALKAWKVPLS